MTNATKAATTDGAQAATNADSQQTIERALRVGATFEGTEHTAEVLHIDMNGPNSDDGESITVHIGLHDETYIANTDGEAISRTRYFNISAIRDKSLSLGAETNVYEANADGERVNDDKITEASFEGKFRADAALEKFLNSETVTRRGD